MKELYILFRKGFFYLLIGLFPLSLSAQTQLQTARSNVTIDQYCNGFYESLPVDYSTSGKSYPLLVFLHGQGEIGDGSPAELSRVLAHGPPQLLSEGTFPGSFTVNGKTFSFIVISPQLNTWPSPPSQEPVAVTDIINYAIAHYRVDTSKMYLTGLSMGAVISCDYAGFTEADNAKRLGALLVTAGTASPSTFRAAQMAKFHLPIWVTNNQGDPEALASTAMDFVQLSIDAGNDPPPKLTIFPVSGHGGWDETYGSLTENGLNVYQWMLQYQRIGDNVVIEGTVLPVDLINYSAAPLGDNQVLVNWSTTNEENNKYFILQRSSDGQTFTNLDTVAAASPPLSTNAYSYTDKHPLSGKNFYRLTQVDLDAKTTYFGVLEVTITTTTNWVLRVSPNPAYSSLTLELTDGGQGALDVKLLDIQGKTLRHLAFQRQGGFWAQLIDVSSLPAGAYFIQVSGKTIQQTASFIKK